MSRLFLEYSGGEAAPGSQGLGGCVCRVSRRRGRVRSVLLSCPGDDTAAQTVAAACASIAYGMLAGGAPLQGTAQALLRNMEGDSYGFALVEMDGQGHLRSVEYQMPAIALVGRGKCRTPWGGEAVLAGHVATLREDQIRPGELCCGFSQGIGRCGAGAALPGGWGRQGALAFLRQAYDGSQNAGQMKELFFAACRGLEQGTDPPGAAFFCRAKEPLPLLLVLGAPRSSLGAEAWARGILAFSGIRAVAGRQAVEMLQRYSGGAAGEKAPVEWIWPDEEALQQLLAQTGGEPGEKEQTGKFWALLEQCTSLRILAGAQAGPGARLAAQLSYRLSLQGKRVEIEYC